MRRILFLWVAAFLAIAALAQSRMTIDQVNMAWQSRTITGVPSGSAVMQLVEVFNKNYPTYCVTEFLKDARLPEAQRQWLVTIDRPNGFVSFAEGSDDASSESMQACQWKRSNGHRLFAVALMQPSSQVKAFTAFFDYNPQTGVLTPEKSLAGLFRPSRPSAMISIVLPQHGKDMYVTEYFINEMLSVKHVYPWDGMKPGTERIEYAVEGEPVTAAQGQRLLRSIPQGEQATPRSQGETPQGNNPYQQVKIDISQLPKTAERVDSYFQYAVYVNKEKLAEEEGEIDVCSVWLADERWGNAVKVCQTNPLAKAPWEQMKASNADAVEVPLNSVAAAEHAYLAPGDVSKVIVEGCPDGRNIWTYIIDPYQHTVKQFPSTEGVQNLDEERKEITLSSYGYHDDGRYSYWRIYSLDGKFLRRIDF